MIYFLILALAAALLLYALVASPKKNRRYKPKGHRASVGRLDKAEVKSKWDSIMAGSGTGGSGLKNSIHEADKLFDYVLISQGTPGDTMGDRLKAARDRFSDRAAYDGVWQAHKLRNALAHEIGFDLVASQAKEALGGFERGLKELGAL
jgi:hypothetical protein